MPNAVQTRPTQTKGEPAIPATNNPVWERWRPVVYDHGLIQAPLEAIGPARAAMYAEDDRHVDLTPVSGSLDEVFAVLPPLSPAPTRELFLATDFGWTVFLRNSILGADPALAMRQLSRRLGVVAMRVCLSGGVRRYPSVMWEMYAPPALGGDARGRRRSIAAANDGGSWVFHQSGAPFDFEDVARYAAPRIRDRFTPEMLAAYLERLGVPPIRDERLRVDGVARAVLLSRPAHANAPQFSLDELAAGKPWARK